MKSEIAEQIIVHEWVKHFTDLPFIHIANERKCTPQRGNLLKKMGVKAGVSDIFIPRAAKGYYGLWLELKGHYGKPSQAQQKFIEHMTREGYHGAIAYGSDEAIAIIKDFYDIP